MRRLASLLLLFMVHVCQSYSGGTHMDERCPEIAFYKKHWKQNKTNGLYYFDAPRSYYVGPVHADSAHYAKDIEQYNANKPEHEKLSPKNRYDRCTRGLSPEEVTKLLGKPNWSKMGFLDSYVMYAYYVDTTYSKVPQDWGLMYVVFNKNTHLSRDFDLQRDVDKIHPIY